MESPFTQELYGVRADGLGAIAVAANGDPILDTCTANGSPLYRFDSAQTLPAINGTSTLHPVSTELSNAGCGLALHPNGFLYSNTNLGVVKLDPDTGNEIGAPFGPAGAQLDIAVDPLTRNLVYGARFGSLAFVDPGLTTTGSFPNQFSGGFIARIAFDSTGRFLLATDNGFNALDIFRRDGTLVQSIPLAVGRGPVGIAFHPGSPGFVVTANVDGTLTRFNFPANDLTLTPTQELFASGGFSGADMQVGRDGCAYVTQTGTRYNDGTVTAQSSIARICGGFSTPAAIASGLPAVGCSPTSIRPGQPTTCTVTVTGSTHPTGSVSFASDSSGNFSSTSCTLVLIGGTQARCSVTYTPNLVQSGTHAISVVYSGDAANPASHTSTRVNVHAGPSLTAVSCTPTTVPVGTASLCVATVSSAAGTATPTGQVSFARNSSGSFDSTACTLVAGTGASASCSVRYTPSAVASGSHTVYANYAGDPDHTPSHASTPITVTP